MKQRSIMVYHCPRILTSSRNKECQCVRTRPVVSSADASMLSWSDLPPTPQPHHRHSRNCSRRIPILASISRSPDGDMDRERWRVRERSPLFLHLPLSRSGPVCLSAGFSSLAHMNPIWHACSLFSRTEWIDTRLIYIPRKSCELTMKDERCVSLGCGNPVKNQSRTNQEPVKNQSKSSVLDIVTPATHILWHFLIQSEICFQIGGFAL